MQRAQPGATPGTGARAWAARRARAARSVRARPRANPPIPRVESQGEHCSFPEERQTADQVVHQHAVAPLAPRARWTHRLPRLRWLPLQLSLGARPQPERAHHRQRFLAARHPGPRHLHDRGPRHTRRRSFSTRFQRSWGRYAFPKFSRSTARVCERGARFTQSPKAATARCGESIWRAWARVPWPIAQARRGSAPVRRANCRAAPNLEHAGSLAYATAGLQTGAPRSRHTSDTSATRRSQHTSDTSDTPRS